MFEKVENKCARIFKNLGYWHQVSKNDDNRIFIQVGYFWRGTGRAVHTQRGLLHEILRQAFPEFIVSKAESNIFMLDNFNNSVMALADNKK